MPVSLQRPPAAKLSPDHPVDDSLQRGRAKTTWGATTRAVARSTSTGGEQQLQLEQHQDDQHSIDTKASSKGERCTPQSRAISQLAHRHRSRLPVLVRIDLHADCDRCSQRPLTRALQILSRQFLHSRSSLSILTRLERWHIQTGMPVVRERQLQIRPQGEGDHISCAFQSLDLTGVCARLASSAHWPTFYPVNPCHSTGRTNEQLRQHCEKLSRWRSPTTGTTRQRCQLRSLPRARSISNSNRVSLEASNNPSSVWNMLVPLQTATGRVRNRPPLQSWPRVHPMANTLEIPCLVLQMAQTEVP